MERREQYDPEDIENLLQERSFDELLEEERAYVLRHLSGREEYEQMRSLLQHVREDDRTQQPIEADDRVRANVMQAFRAQQQPQWRVWLNTLGGLFQPSEGFAMWRPALALGMLLVLFGVGFYLVRGPLAGPSVQELAEVRRQNAEEPLPVRKPQTADTISNALTTSEPEQQTEKAVTDEAAAKSEDQSAPAPAVARQPAAFDALEEVEYEVAEERMETVVTEPMADQVQQEKSMETDLFAAPASSGHVVTEAEMYRNQSMANATGKVQPSVMKESKAKALGETADRDKAVAANSRPVSQDPALLVLLSAGW